MLSLPKHIVISILCRYPSTIRQAHGKQLRVTFSTFYEFVIFNSLSFCRIYNHEETLEARLYPIQ
jgi:hypothetical protein